MSVTNLTPKKRLKTDSVQPKYRSDFNVVTATATVSKLVREQSARTEVIITNTSTAILYIALSFLPSATNYTIALQPNSTFLSDTTDAINGVWASAAGGQANITERY